MASTARAAPRPKTARRASSSGRGRARAGSRRKSAGGIRWDRLARITLLVVLFAILLSYLGPATNYLRSWQLSHQTSSEVKGLREDNARLRQRARLLQDPDQVELQARRMGMARPGERVYVIRNLPKDR